MLVIHYWFGEQPKIERNQVEGLKLSITDHFRSERQQQYRLPNDSSIPKSKIRKKSRVRFSCGHTTHKRPSRNNKFIKTPTLPATGLSDSIPNVNYFTPHTALIVSSTKESFTGHDISHSLQSKPFYIHIHPKNDTSKTKTTLKTRTAVAVLSIQM